MEANVKRQDGVLVVELRGRLNIEGTFAFRQACLEQWLADQVIFDLKELSFVGSLGLKDFVDTVDHMSTKSARGVRLCGVSSEFRRMFESTGVAARGICGSRAEALSSLIGSAAAAGSPLATS